jgi:Fur family peroxide stress response transcriptional regulator
MTVEEHNLIEFRLRKAGLKLTPQRFAVLDYLVCSEIHPTAEQIMADLNEHFPRASRATVYNTLNTLRDAGLVYEVFMDDAVARYDANLDPHHHFLCRSCGKLEDVPFDAVNEISHLELKSGYSIEVCSVVMRGVCADCGGRNGH